MYLTALVKDGMIVLKRMNVPLYSSKYSKKTYTVHQHLLCLCIKEIQQQSYRDCRDFLDDFDNLKDALGLNSVPHYTTLQKSLQRFPARWYKILLKKLICLVKSHANAVIDGTGVMQNQASSSYMQRIGREIKKRDYFKIIMVIDPDDGLILSYKGVHGTHHESPYLIPLIEDIPLKLDEICSDKGFDSEKNQRYIATERKACSYVDIRGIPKRGRYRKQVYRRKRKNLDQWNTRYHRMRNSMESKNYSIKHQFGDYIPGNNIHIRRRYLAIRVLAANLINLHKSGKINKIFFYYVLSQRISTRPIRSQHLYISKLK